MVSFHFRRLLETDEKRTVYPNGTLTVALTTIEDDGVYACHVTYQGQQIPSIYRYQIQVQSNNPLMIRG